MRSRQELLQVDESVAIAIRFEEVVHRESVVPAILPFQQVQTLAKADLSVAIGVDERKSAIEVFDDGPSQLKIRYFKRKFRKFSSVILMNLQNIIKTAKLPKKIALSTQKKIQYFTKFCQIA